MAVVRLRPPLRELAGGQRELVLAGQTVGDVLRRLENEHPKLAGLLASVGTPPPTAAPRI